MLEKELLVLSGPCTFDSTLCENDGRCIDDPTVEKGFKCICSNQYEGEFCQEGKRDIQLLAITRISAVAINMEETTEQVYTNSMLERSSDNLLK